MKLLTLLLLRKKEYNTIKEACEDKELNTQDLKYETVLWRINSKKFKTLEEVFYSLGVNEVTVFGKRFKDLKCACENKEVNKFNLTYITVNLRKNSNKYKSLEEIFMTPTKRKRGL